jgi:hypothetical protein
MDTNIYSDQNNLTDNFGGILVHWMRKVLEIKVDKSKGSGKNEQTNDPPTTRFYLKHKSNDPLERKITTI